MVTPNSLSVKETVEQVKIILFYWSAVRS